MRRRASSRSWAAEYAASAAPNWSCGKSFEGALGLGGTVQGNVKILCLLSPRPSFQFGGGLVPRTMGHPRCSHVGRLADVLDEERGGAAPLDSRPSVRPRPHGETPAPWRYEPSMMRTKSASRHASAPGRLLSQGKVVGELAAHIGDTAALPRELPNDHARFVEVARARHAVGPLKLKPIRQSAVHEKAPQRQRRLFAKPRGARNRAGSGAPAPKRRDRSPRGETHHLPLVRRSRER